ncbi:MbtH family protein [Wenzhouxiangella marina]|uniref:Antibiotic synthesis protein MbtH n=1 Tax=Wenzhouxiangella marina TaxID=1579979 RepID=A0A0K0XZH1_9GAMM|nr:MbtH family protein [Wenzhouxiangella marina]AKS43021.1 antibiotic synthesis protein MbtH [Wenzhouxiangella marina]MBB6087296.1 MbtH protein [Wenzhouxiangella marina]
MQKSMVLVFMLLALVAGSLQANWEDQDANQIYKVIINHEEQYSIWPADRENPAGWRDAGFSGVKQDCLNYIERVWTDMRPLSQRRPGGG